MNTTRKVIAIIMMSMLFFNCGINAISGWGEGYRSFNGIIMFMAALSPLIGGVAGGTAGIILGAQKAAAEQSSQIMGALIGAAIGLPVGVLVPISLGYPLVYLSNMINKYEDRKFKEKSTLEFQESIAKIKKEQKEKEQNSLPQ